jgi:MarR family transcriptional regulator, 2-MHQ and catechol-resistance regulon repressor
VRYDVRVDTDPALQDERLTTVGLLAETWAGLHGTLERLLRQECGLSTQWFEVLLRLARSPGQRLRMCDLAAQVSMSPSGLTRAVDRLEEEGLVRREHCPGDRRVSWAQLTEAGLARIEAAVPVHLEHLQEHFLAPLDTTDVAELTRVLRTLRDHVNPSAAQVSDPADVAHAAP